MSDLLREALLEAKKIKEIAEQDATKSVVDALSPYIKNIISKQITEASGHEFLFQEEEETTDTSGLDLTSDPTVGDKSMEAPIQTGASMSGGQDVVNAAMPGQDGLITINVEDLFATDTSAVPALSTPAPNETPMTDVAPEASPEVAPATTPDEENVGIDLPVEDESKPIMESFDSWKNGFLEVSEKVDMVYFAKEVPSIVTESIKNKLFSLLENLDFLKEKGKINSEQRKMNENKLDFLFMKLKDAENSNSYIKKVQKEDESMTSLKEYAAKLFAESFEGKETNHKPTASAKHAADVSGVAPGVDLGVASKSSGKKEEHWDEVAPSLDEKDQDKVIEEALAAVHEEVEAEGSAGYGDTDEKPSVEPMLEIDEKELQEAIRQLKKESIKKKMAKLKENTKVPEGDQGSVKPVGGKDPAQKNLNNKPGKSNLKDVPELTMEDVDLLAGGEGEDLELGDDLSGDVDGVGGEAGEADLTIDIDLPVELEDMLADIDPSVADGIDVSLGDVNLGGDEEGSELGGESEGGDELLLDTEDEGSEDELEVEDDVGSEEMDLMKESVNKLNGKTKLLESKLVSVAKVAKSLQTENKTLKAELQEANLFIAKNVYFTKFLQRGDLSKTNLTKIVDYLDRAKTVNEAKEIYSKIKVKLAESAAASTKLTGSASQATKSGSAVSLNESVSHDESDVIDRKRWQFLANIKSNDE